MAEDKDELELERDEGLADGATAGFVRPGELLGALKASAEIDPKKGLFVGNELRAPKDGHDDDYGSVDEGQKINSLDLLRELMPEVEWVKVTPSEVVGMVRENVRDIALIVVNRADIGSVRAGCVDMPANVALLPDLTSTVDTSNVAIATVSTTITPVALRNLINGAFYKRIDFLRNVELVRETLASLKAAMVQISSSLERIRSSIPRHELNEKRGARTEAGQFPVYDEDFDPMMDEASQGVERIVLALDQFQETLPVLDTADLAHHVRNPLGFLTSNLDTLIVDIQSAKLEVPGIMTDTRNIVATFKAVVDGFITRFQDK